MPTTGLACFFWLGWSQTEVHNEESLIRLSTVSDEQWPTGHWGENYSAEAWCHCVKVWSVVVQRELSSLPYCFLICNFGDDGVDSCHYWWLCGVISGFFSEEKNLGNRLPRQSTLVLLKWMFHKPICFEQSTFLDICGIFTARHSIATNFDILNTQSKKNLRPSCGHS